MNLSRDTSSLQRQWQTVRGTFILKPPQLGYRSNEGTAVRPGLVTDTLSRATCRFDRPHGHGTGSSAWPSTSKQTPKTFSTRSTSSAGQACARRLQRGQALAFFDQVLTVHGVFPQVAECICVGGCRRRLRHSATRASPRSCARRCWPSATSTWHSPSSRTPWNSKTPNAVFQVDKEEPEHRFIGAHQVIALEWRNLGA